MMHIYHKQDEGIRIIDNISETNPSLDINTALTHYLDIELMNN